MNQNMVNQVLTLGNWLGKQDSNQSMHFLCIASNRRKMRAKLRRSSWISGAKAAGAVAAGA
jgi:hypothetical protein